MRIRLGRFTMKWKLFLLVIFIVLPAAPALGIQYNVNRTADAADAIPGDCICDANPPAGACTLRAAIMEANHCIGADKIILQGRVYNLTKPPSPVSDEIGGDLDIDMDSANSNSLTIRGTGRKTVINAAAIADRVIQITGQGERLLIENLTIAGGNAQLPLATGGGIESYGDAVMLSNVAVKSNSAMAGGGIYNGNVMILNNVSVTGNNAQDGGGIFNAFANSVMTLNNVTIAENTSAGGGAGFSTKVGAITNLNNVTVARNTAGMQAGVILIDTGGVVATRNSIVSEQTQGIDCQIINGSVVSSGYNIESATSCGLTVAGDQQNVANVGLEFTLGNYGGAADTLPLRWPSAAIDTGDPAGCFGDPNGDGIDSLLSEDQRGIARVDLVTIANNAPAEVCDISAAEMNDLVVNGTLSVAGGNLATNWNVLHPYFLDWATPFVHLVADGLNEEMSQTIQTLINGLSGDQYLFRIRANTNVLLFPAMSAQIQYVDLNGVTQTAATIVLNQQAGNWQAFSTVITIPADYTQLTVIALSAPAWQNGYVEIDDVQLLIR